MVVVHTAEAPRREVHQGEAIAWMEEHTAPEFASVVTSLPDTSELPALGFEGWRAWFVASATRVMRWVPEEGVAIFYQSDVLHDGALVDKGYLVGRAAEDAGSAVLWHKIVCRSAPGTIAQGRPTYSHMIAVARTTPRRAAVLPDVLPDGGPREWTRGMGVEACRVACRYLRDATPTRTVVDPFCGRGTVLAVANELGFDAIGVELGGRRCRAARSLSVRGGR